MRQPQTPGISKHRNEQFSGGFSTRPVSLILLLIAVGSLAWPIIRDRRDSKRRAAGTISEVETMSGAFDVEED